MGADSMGADKLVANQNGSQKQDQIKLERKKMGANTNVSKKKWKRVKMGAKNWI